MRRLNSWLFIGTFTAVAAWAGAPRRSPETGPLRLIQSIELPGVEGRIDHLAVDVKRQRLFVAALGNNTMEVVDLAKGQHSRSIKGLHEPQGIAYALEVDRIFVANGQGGACVVFDGPSLNQVQVVQFQDDADNVRYDAAARQIVVGYGDGALGIIDAASGSRIADIPLAKHPESFQLEKGGNRIFVNVPKAGHIAVVDRSAKKVVSTWPVAEARANYPMAFDNATQRLWIGCRTPARMLLWDARAGNQISNLEIVGDTDDLFFDAARRRLYVIGGEGAIDVFQQRDSDRYEKAGRTATAAGARTGLFVPELNRVFLAVPHRGAQRAEIRVYEPSS